MSIRIILADDHNIFRESLAALLNRENGFEVVAQAGDGRTAVALIRKLQPAVVLMDISMPELNGIEATRQIIDQYPKTKIIALSMHSDRKFVAEMLKAGASGYLLKDADAEELIRAIHTVIKEGIYLPPVLTDMVVEGFVRHRSVDEMESAVALTSREREVLQLVSEGKTTKEIAQKFGISIKTIECHRLKIMEKLNLHSIAELTKYAIREGLTSIEG
jgi:two-component system, NarL family, response regulator NreC